MKVRDIMTKDVITVKKGTTVEQVAKIMVDQAVDSVPVVDEGGRLVGMISDRDLIYKDVEPSMPATIEYLGGIIFLNGVEEYQEELKKLSATYVEQMMSDHVISITEDHSLYDAADIIAHKKVHAVPVVRDDKVVGIVSGRDIVKTLIQ